VRQEERVIHWIERRIQGLLGAWDVDLGVLDVWMESMHQDRANRQQQKKSDWAKIGRCPQWSRQF